MRRHWPNESKTSCFEYGILMSVVRLESIWINHKILNIILIYVIPIKLRPQNLKLRIRIEWLLVTMVRKRTVRGNLCISDVYSLLSWKFIREGHKVRDEWSWHLDMMAVCREATISRRRRVFPMEFACYPEIRTYM